MRQAAKVAKQVDSALLRELLGVDEGARFVPVAAVIALLRDAAGAELPRARTEQLLALLGIERQPKVGAVVPTISVERCVVAALSETAMQRSARAAAASPAAEAKGTRWAAADARHRRQAGRPPDAPVGVRAGLAGDAALADGRDRMSHDLYSGR